MLNKRLCFVSLQLFLFYAIPAVVSYDSVNNELIIQDNLYSPDVEVDGVEFLRSRRAVPPSTRKPEFSGGSCYGFQGTKGRCLPLESCVLKPLQEDYIKYKDYFCITKKRSVGVCCPNAIAFPEKYGRRRREAGIKPEGLQVNSNVVKKLQYKRDAVVNDPPTSIKAEMNTCGRNGKDLSEELNAVTWPWLASLKIAGTLVHFCGATLITRYHLLSAAHCFVLEGGIAKKENVIVRLGEYDFNNTVKASFSDHKVASIIYHEDYDVFTYENDIAILLLEKPAQYSVYIQPICMPKIEEYADRKGIVAGWGHVKTGGPGSEVLREIEVPVWTRKSCEENMVQTIFSTNVCAGDEDGKKDACQNDSGGPLMMRRSVGLKGRWELAGIVSWGVKCAQKGRPGVYTQVNKYLDWIYEKLGD